MYIILELCPGIELEGPLIFVLAIYSKQLILLCFLITQVNIYSSDVSGSTKFNKHQNKPIIQKDDISVMLFP